MTKVAGMNLLNPGQTNPFLWRLLLIAAIGPFLERIFPDYCPASVTRVNGFRFCMNRKD